MDDTLRAIYDASLSMGKQLGMDVVAEGVEDRNDWELLRQTGCDFAQGNFISVPLLPDDFLRWTAEWQNRVREGLISASA
jgi:EAL domain-containing protein (putative c-di-GMP-specific phosphodiesterase class I)